MSLQAIKSSVMKFIKDEEGLTIVEYAVAGGLITLGVVVAFGLLGDEVENVITAITTTLQENQTGGVAN
ncbi:Flp family type IVb pilin [Azotobacter chroococcum]|uniref:Flp family type IVb pilin n=1 Tax=Azotobacter chroococcum TaxID=353 RepID=UPI00103AB7C9|nr:Flp family type IVb pilin [Azotobacter chroococcum]TBW34367.1 Flp family type IVb pilin [Azotobacter chroococcum]